MKRGGRRAQSEVITTVLIILLVLASVIIVWNVVSRTIKSGTEQATTEQFDVSITGKDGTLLVNYVKIPVTRNAGIGNVSGFKFIIKNSSGASFTYENKTSLTELESRTFVIDGSSIKNPVSYEVYPIISSNGKEIIGMKSSGKINLITQVYYIDSDGDKYGTGEPSETQINSNYKLLGSADLIGIGDCNDNDVSIKPGIAELRNNNIDNNCDGFEEIDICQALSASGLRYELAGNIDSEVNICLTVDADNIVIDGKGYGIKINDPACYGGYCGSEEFSAVKINQRTNVVLRNLVITDNGANGSPAIGVGGGGNNILVEKSSLTVIEGLSFLLSGNSIKINENSISNSNINGGGAMNAGGIYITGDSVEITKNNIEISTEAGYAVYVQGSNGIGRDVISQNTINVISGNTISGIVLEGLRNSLIYDNSVTVNCHQMVCTGIDGDGFDVYSYYGSSDVNLTANVIEVRSETGDGYGIVGIVGFSSSVINLNTVNIVGGRYDVFGIVSQSYNNLTGNTVNFVSENIDLLTGISVGYSDRIVNNVVNIEGIIGEGASVRGISISGSESVLTGNSACSSPFSTFYCENGITSTFSNNKCENEIEEGQEGYCSGLNCKSC